MITKRLPSLWRGFEIVAKVQETLQKPRLFVEPIVGQDRLIGARATKRRRECAKHAFAGAIANRFRRVSFMLLDV